MNGPKIELTTIPVSQDDISTNLQTGVIVVTEDKLIRILEKDRERTKQNLAWSTPASFLITLIIAILTTEFRMKWGMPAETWQALFYIGTGVAALITLIFVIKMKKKTIEELLKEIKGQ
ncbi:hypothetical protein [Enterobacter soli]|uniref:hypothetical protein n=1 Tax=Enterobacter soli TaxID=885040 RepID=UPI002F425E7E